MIEGVDISIYSEGGWIMGKKVLLIAFLVVFVFCAYKAPIQAQIMPAGGPGDSGTSISEGARTILNKDGDLDSRIESYMARVRKGSVTYENTKERLEDYRQEAQSRLRYWTNNFHSSDNSILYQAVYAMLLLQTERCRELYDATVYEQNNGYEAAKFKWQIELETLERYKSAVKKVKNSL